MEDTPGEEDIERERRIESARQALHRSRRRGKNSWTAGHKIRRRYAFHGACCIRRCPSSGEIIRPRGRIAPAAAPRRVWGAGRGRTAGRIPNISATGANRSSCERWSARQNPTYFSDRLNREPKIFFAQVLQ